MWSTVCAVLIALLILSIADNMKLRNKIKEGTTSASDNKQSTQSICKTCKKRFHCDVWALEHNEYPLELVVSSCREYVLDS